MVALFISTISFKFQGVFSVWGIVLKISWKYAGKKAYSTMQYGSHPNNCDFKKY